MPHSFKERNECFSSCKNRTLKGKCDEMELAKEKNGVFYTVYLARKKFFNICLLFQCIMYYRSALRAISQAPLKNISKEMTFL